MNTSFPFTTLMMAVFVSFFSVSCSSTLAKSNNNLAGELQHHHHDKTSEENCKLVASHDQHNSNLPEKSVYEDQVNYSFSSTKSARDFKGLLDQKSDIFRPQSRNPLLNRRSERPL